MRTAGMGRSWKNCVEHFNVAIECCSWDVECLVDASDRDRVYGQPLFSLM
jgi:hypothetical protein